MSYIHEERFGIKELITDLQDVRAKIENGKIKKGLIVLHEKASQDSFIEKFYTNSNKTEVLAK